MQMDTLILLGASVGGIVVMAVSILITYSKLYKRASADEALVRTGKGGTAAVAGGGLWVIPIFHEIQHVSLRQIKIPIDRTGKDALVTSDKIEADVEGMMFVRVGDEPDDIVQAAKTFGQISDNDINSMIRDKVTDAMRAEAMKVTFLNLNVQKREFAESIGSSVAEDLKKTGLVLDTVAVTSIQQVKVDPDAIPMDVFKAEGARNIVEVVEKNREETNRIRRQKQVEIQKTDVEAREKSLALEMQRKKAEAEQARDVADYEAQKHTEARQAILEQERLAEVAALSKAEEVAKREVHKAQAIAVEESKRAEIEAVAAAKAEEAARTAEIAKERAVETARVEKEQTILTAKVAKEQAVEAAEVEKARALAEVETAKALALAQQANAEAEAEVARQGIETVTETAGAERAKQVAVLQAEEKARQQVIEAEAERDSRTAKADAEAQEAKARARAQREAASGAADAHKTEAEGVATATLTRAEAAAKAATLDAEAQKILAEAKLADGQAEAESMRLMVEAQNQVDPTLLLRDVALAVVEQAPEAIRAFMEPAAAISDVKVIQMGGLGNSNGNGSSDQMPNGLPGMLAGTLAQSAGLLPVINALTSFAQESGLTDKAKGALTSAAGHVRSATMAGNGKAEVAPEAPEAPEAPTSPAH